MNLLLSICLVADIDLPGSWPATIQTEAGLCGLLAIGVLILTFAHLCKKMFGAKPPLDDQLKEVVKLLRSEIHREKNSALKDFKLRLEPVKLLGEQNRDSIAEIQLDRVRKWGELKDEIHTIANDVAYLRGIRKGEAE